MGLDDNQGVEHVGNAGPMALSDSDSPDSNGGGDFSVKRRNQTNPIPVIRVDSPERTGPAITYDGIAALLDNKLKNVAKTEDLDSVRADLCAVRQDISEMANRTPGNEHDIRELKDALQKPPNQGRPPYYKMIRNRSHCTGDSCGRDSSRQEPPLRNKKTRGSRNMSPPVH